MTKRDAVILAHRGESEGARTYEELDSPIQVSRLVLLPLCAEKLAPQRIIPPLRLSVHKSKLSVLVVPALEEKLVPVCKPVPGMGSGHAGVGPGWQIVIR